MSTFQQPSTQAIGNDLDQETKVSVVEEIEIISACIDGEFDSVKRLIDEDPTQLDFVDNDNVSPLHWACLEGHIDIVKFLVESGVAIDIQTKEEGQTPLAWACIRGHCRIVHYLVNHGAQVDIVDNRSYHILHHAAMHNCLEVIYYLMCIGVPVDVKDNQGHTALTWAAYLGHIPSVELLLRYNADINNIDSAGNTALHWSAKQGHLFMCDALLVSGVDVHVCDSNGKNAKQIAHSKGYDGVVNALASAEKNPEAAKQGRFRYSNSWFYVGLLFVPLIFMVFSSLSIFISVPLIAISVIGLWKYIGQQRWIGIKYGRNPFWIGLFLGSYLISAYCYFFQISSLYSITSFSGLFFFSSNVAFVVCYAKLVAASPGEAIKTHFDREEFIATLEAASEYPQYCMTCMIKKPIRAKHCRTCKRCVSKFDHHCPWTNGDIGPNNHKIFIATLSIIVVNHLQFLLFIFNFAWNYGDLVQMYYTHTLVVILFVYHFASTCWQSYTLLTQLWLISRSLTTNEYMNQKRYSYLLDPVTKRFKNPFDKHSIIENFKDFMNTRVEYWQNLYFPSQY
eukprot:TRINITY_DN9820_c0_g1_i1.p1 TRINITY_DN9820_c0_g1~~TRINITY_DN9820_c0_g1_i1.p1  ORF type:complete len:565 (-),score=83.68 TRINITY_DN9820_c0_g1_i1:24-1718(-)